MNLPDSGTAQPDIHHGGSASAPKPSVAKHVVQADVNHFFSAPLYKKDKNRVARLAPAQSQSINTLRAPTCANPHSPRDGWELAMALLRLEYALTHPYPRSKLFTTITFVLIALVLPVLVIVNIITVGHELVPSLRPDFQQNDTVPSWWVTTPLAPILRRKAPLCQPKDFGRGDTFRLSPSLFEYKVLSSWRTDTNITSGDEGRVEYRGGSFNQCYVYSIRFDLDIIESTQTLTVAIVCPVSPVVAFLETRIVFAIEVSKDIVGQYYGYGIDVIGLVGEESWDYRRIVFAMMDVISTDSLSILDRNRVDWLSLSTRAAVNEENPVFSTTNIMAKNGTGYMTGNNTMGEAEVYRATITNLMRVVQHAVQLDLSNPGSDNIFTNSSAINSTFSANPPPAGIDPNTWVDKNSFRYGWVTAPHSTFAGMLRAG
ncbi:unnamed protein product, partial [Rhizoctonia solani]